jgi:hypothetical protein
MRLDSWSESESYVMTDGQSASLSWNKAPIWGLRPDFYYRRTVAGLLDSWSSQVKVKVTLRLTAGCRDPRLNIYMQAENKTPCCEVHISIATIWLTQRCPTVNSYQYLLPWKYLFSWNP